MISWEQYMANTKHFSGTIPFVVYIAKLGLCQDVGLPLYKVDGCKMDQVMSRASQHEHFVRDGNPEIVLCKQVNHRLMNDILKAFKKDLVSEEGFNKEIEGLFSFTDIVVKHKAKYILNEVISEYDKDALLWKERCTNMQDRLRDKDFVISLLESKIPKG